MNALMPRLSLRVQRRRVAVVFARLLVPAMGCTQRLECGCRCRSSRSPRPQKTRESASLAQLLMISRRAFCPCPRLLNTVRGMQRFRSNLRRQPRAGGAGDAPGRGPALVCHLCILCCDGRGARALQRQRAAAAHSRGAAAARPRRRVAHAAGRAAGGALALGAALQVHRCALQPEKEAAFALVSCKRLRHLWPTPCAAAAALATPARRGAAHERCGPQRLRVRRWCQRLAGQDLRGDGGAGGVDLAQYRHEKRALAFLSLLQLRHGHIKALQCAATRSRADHNAMLMQAVHAGCLGSPLLKF